jgi:hypothetical protein
LKLLDLWIGKRSHWWWESQLLSDHNSVCKKVDSSADGEFRIVVRYFGHSDKIRIGQNDIGGLHIFSSPHIFLEASEFLIYLFQTAY